MISNLGIPIEKEASMVIYSYNPKQAMEKLSSISSIGRYRLIYQPPKFIHDIYFDTNSKLLKHKKIACRLRNEDSKQFITLKGESLPSGSGRKRTELEMEWSPDTIEKITADLSKIGVSLNREDMSFGSEADPIEFMMNAGLIIIQNRETYRQVRNITLDGDLNSIIAELDIDSTLYRFDTLNVNHYNVEVEQKSEISRDEFNSIIDTFKELGSEIRLWNYSKLATGIALKELLYVQHEKELFNDDNELTPIAYDRIESLLQKGLV